jgi:hypothetical protein
MARLLAAIGRPRLRDTTAVGPSVANARRSRYTWRRPSPTKVLAASTVSRRSDKSISTRSRVSSRSLIRTTVIARHPKRPDDNLSQ